MAIRSTSYVFLPIDCKQIQFGPKGPGIRFFGERALLKKEPRAATVKATTECILLMIDAESFMIVKDAIASGMPRATYG